LWGGKVCSSAFLWFKVNFPRMAMELSFLFLVLVRGTYVKGRHAISFCSLLVMLRKVMPWSLLPIFLFEFEVNAHVIKSLKSSLLSVCARITWWRDDWVLAFRSLVQYIDEAWFVRKAGSWLTHHMQLCFLHLIVVFRLFYYLC
jgi:hypothetical protein